MQVTIASIHFAPLHADRLIYGGVWNIPAVPLNGNPEKILVRDMVQRDEGPFSLGEGGNRRIKLRYPVYAEHIARDIVGEWTTWGRGMTPEIHPGVWIVRTNVPVMETDAEGLSRIAFDVNERQIFDPVSPAVAQDLFTQDWEAAKLADRQYAEWCFREASGIAGDPRLIPFIPKNYIRAARHYGYEAPFLKEGGEQMAPCPWCTTVVSRAAVVCPKCTHVLDVEQYARYEAQRAFALRKAAADLQAENAARVTESGRSAAA